MSRGKVDRPWREVYPLPPAIARIRPVPSPVERRLSVQSIQSARMRISSKVMDIGNEKKIKNKDKTYILDTAQRVEERSRSRESTTRAQGKTTKRQIGRHVLVAHSCCCASHTGAHK